MFETRTIATAAAIMLAALSGSACAMGTNAEPVIRCTVDGAEKLPAELGGSAGVCAALKRAIASKVEGTGVDASAVSVAVEVRSQHEMSAVTSVGGRTFAAQEVATSDRPLNARALDMLARAVAGQIE